MYTTGIIEANLNECDSIEELKQRILPLLQSQRSAWAEKIEQILSDRGYSCRQLAQLCKVSEPAVRKWRRGSLPQSRDMYIRIGFAAGYDLAEMNAFLKRYGKCPQLYVKSLEDSVCIFILQSDVLPHTYEAYLHLLEMVRAELQPTLDSHATAYTTSHLSSFLSGLSSVEQMMTFVKIHTSSYRQAYARLYSYIIAFLQINLTNEFTASGDGRKASFHSMATESRWSSSLRQCISEIRNRRWFPLRHKLISLGLHLNMDACGINQMLRFAQMEPLYAKNPLEAAILWAIEEAKLSTLDDEIIPDGSSELCEFVKDILMQLDLSEEYDYLINDL